MLVIGAGAGTTGPTTLHPVILHSPHLKKGCAEERAQDSCACQSPRSSSPYLFFLVCWYLMGLRPGLSQVLWLLDQPLHIATASHRLNEITQGL